MSQSPYPNSAFHLLGEERIDTLGGNGRNRTLAIQAFEWEIKVRKALLAPTEITEITLRNAIDKAIDSWWNEKNLPRTWTDTPLPIEAESLMPFVHSESWKKRAKSNLPKGRQINHEDLIAHTSFGTWKNMIGNPLSLNQKKSTGYNQIKSWNAAKKRDEQCSRLWREIISTAFPYLPQTKSARGKLSPRAYIGTRVARTAALRNRTFHWDNLTKTNIAMRYKDMLEIVSSINPQVGDWMDGICAEQIKSVIENKPSWL